MLLIAKPIRRYDKTKTGVVTADDFRQMWKEAKENLHAQLPVGGAHNGHLAPPLGTPGQYQYQYQRRQYPYRYSVHAID